jgi:hypothetical protein
MLRDVNPTRPDAGARDTGFAEAIRRAEGGPPTTEPHPLDPIARMHIGRVVRRNGEHLALGPLLDVSDLPLLSRSKMSQCLPLLPTERFGMIAHMMTARIGSLAVDTICPECGMPIEVLRGSRLRLALSSDPVLPSAIQCANPDCKRLFRWDGEKWVLIRQNATRPT